MSTKATHTPGPWEVEECNTPNGKGLSIMHFEEPTEEGGEPIIDEIAEVVMEYAPGVAEANANLLAAAPPMLELLRTCRGNVNSLCGTNPNAHKEWLAEIDRVIALAGVSPTQTLPRFPIFDAMLLDTPVGHKIILTHPDAGHTHHMENAKKHLQRGKAYTLKTIEVGQSLTTVTLKEAPGVYSSVQFSNAPEAGGAA